MMHTIISRFIFSFILLIGLCFSTSAIAARLFIDGDDPGNYSGKIQVELRSKKKIMAAMTEWVSAAIQNPPMVFSVIRSSADSLEVKAVTEVPSSHGLHPVSFRLILVPFKNGFSFRATEFYFEDIRLTLETWLEKYEDSENDRNQKNVSLITKGIGSHISLGMDNLAEKINTYK